MATNEPTQSYRKVTIGSDRNFGIIFAAVFCVIALGPLVHGGLIRSWALVISVCFLACAFLIPRWLRPLNLLWFRFGLLLHHVVNPIVMGALYFGAVVPMGMLLHAVGKDLLRLKFDRAAATYWIPRDPPAPPLGGMTKQF
jgi:hypothetical protein